MLIKLLKFKNSKKQRDIPRCHQTISVHLDQILGDNINFLSIQTNGITTIITIGENLKSQLKYIPDIYNSTRDRNKQVPRLKIFFEILWVLFLEISVFYSDWSKSWIWRTLGHIRDIFCKCYLHNASKQVFCPNFFKISCTSS